MQTTMTTHDSDVIAARERARAAGLPPRAGGLRARQRLPSLRRRRAAATSTSSRASASRRSATRTRASPPRSRRRRDSCSTRRTCSSIRCRGRSRRGSPTLSGLPRAFFCNSGTEAVEACLKFARRYWYAQGTPRTAIVAFEHSFHGRTMGALSVTWDEHYRAPFSAAARRRDVRLDRRSRGAAGGGHRRRPRRSSSSRCRVKGASGR